MIRVGEHSAAYHRQFLLDMTHDAAGNAEHLQIAKHALHEILEQELTPRQREVVMLYFFEGKNTIVIAEELHLNKSTVSRTLARAKDRIQKHMRFYFAYTSYQLTE